METEYKINYFKYYKDMALFNLGATLVFIWAMHSAMQKEVFIFPTSFIILLFLVGGPTFMINSAGLKYETRRQIKNIERLE